MPARTLTPRHSVYFVSTVPSVWSYCDPIGVTRTELEHLEIRPSSRSRYAVSVVAKSTFKADRSMWTSSLPLLVCQKSTVVSLLKIDRCQSVLKNRGHQTETALKTTLKNAEAKNLSNFKKNGVEYGASYSHQIKSVNNFKKLVMICQVIDTVDNHFHHFFDIV